MNRQEFITKILSLYPDTFREDRVEYVQAWVEMYEKAIRKNWDMDKLMFYFATQYKSTVVPPHPSFFFAFANDVKPKQSTHTQVYEPMSEEERQKSLEIMKRLGEQMRKIAKDKNINNKI